MYVDISIPRIALTRAMGKVSSSAYFAPTSPLKLADITDPPLPGDEWVRVRNHMCGICGSDIVEWYRLPRAPLVPGHEIGGEVVETGAAVKNFKAGDRVFIKSILDAEGIVYFIQGEYVAPYLFNALPMRIMVRKDQADKAFQILKDIELSYSYKFRESSHYTNK